MHKLGAYFGRIIRLGRVKPDERCYRSGYLDAISHEAYQTYHSRSRMMVSKWVRLVEQGCGVGDDGSWEQPQHQKSRIAIQETP
jgi:hypothetical protein